MKSLFIFDIDGTIADMNHRVHFIDNSDDINWDGFYNAAKHDTVIQSIATILRIILASGADVLFFTGREETCRGITEKWLLDNFGIEQSELKLFMRSKGNRAEDSTIKQVWYERLSQMDKERLICVFEDRDRVVQMWRSIGVKCLQVAEGKF